MDYLTACNQAGKFVGPETGLNEEATISLDAPRKWRQLKERTSDGAFYGMQIVTYRKSFVPSLVFICSFFNFWYILLNSSHELLFNSYVCLY